MISGKVSGEAWHGHMTEGGLEIFCRSDLLLFWRNLIIPKMPECFQTMNLTKVLDAAVTDSLAL